MKNYRKHLTPPPPVACVVIACVFALSLFSCKITTSEPDTFAVAFDANGGSGAIESIAKTENEEFELPANTFTRTGYTFSGWSTDKIPNESSKSYKDKEKIKLTEDLTLYAQWAAGTGTAYKVEHWQQNVADDGYTLAKTEPITGTTGEETAAKEEEAVGFTAKEFAQAKIAADGSTVVKIYYDRKIITLTFDADNGEDKTTLSGKFGAEIVPPAPEKADFIFTGWSTDKIPNESSKFYNDKEKITLTEDLTLYAQWKEISYKINYEMNGGTNASENPSTFKKSDNVTLKEPTYEYFDFCGWYLTQDFAGESITGWNVGEKTSDITLYAKWTVKAENLDNAIKNLKDGEHSLFVTNDITSEIIKTIGKTLRTKSNAKVKLFLDETENLTEIPMEAFISCENLIEITIPDSVTSIKRFAFSNCINLANIKISNKIEKIEDFVFSNCSSLKTIELSETLTDIGMGVFERCSSLIEMPKNIPTIGTSLFSNCTSLTKAEIPENITTVGDSAFYGCSSLKDVVISNNVTSIESMAFFGCTSLTNIELPISISSISYGTFQNCSSLEEILIPYTVTSIEANAFSDCTSLTNINLPANITEISENLFYGCSELVSITIPSNVSLIDSGAFSNCTNLREIVFSARVKNINWGAFNNCSNLRTVNFAGTSEQWNSISVDNYNDENNYLLNAKINYLQ